MLNGFTMQGDRRGCSPLFAVAGVALAALVFACSFQATSAFATPGENPSGPKPAGAPQLTAFADDGLLIVSDEDDADDTAATKPFKGSGTYYLTLGKSAKKVFGMKNEKRYDGVAGVVSKRRNTNLQKFAVSPAGGGRHYIKNVATGRLLTAVLNDAETSGKAVMKARSSSKSYRRAYQSWVIEVNPDKTVSFTCPDTKLRLSLAGKKAKAGAAFKVARAKNNSKSYAVSYQCFKLKKTKKVENEAVSIGVPCYWQNPQLPTGCESVALTNALNYWGFGLAKTAIARSWMPYGSSGLYNFIGSPWNSSGWIICAPGITNTANKYLSSKNSKLKATNVSGKSLKSLRTYLDKGYPVVVWTSMYMGSPWNYSGSKYAAGHRYPFYHNNHAVVLTGYNPKTGRYQVSDSLSGRVWRNGGSFAWIYSTMGSQAVVIHDSGIKI